MLDEWKPLEVKYIGGDRELKIGDTANLSPGTPVLNSKAVNALKDILADDVEILPLKHESVKYFALNVVKVLDCLDHEESEFERYPDSGEIMWCNKYVFFTEKVAGHHIFKVPETLRGLVLVSDDFRNKVLERGLQGFLFRELWDCGK